MRRKPPCDKYCPRRNEHCHSACKEYADFVSGNEADKALRREVSRQKADASAVRRDAVIRASKQKRQKPCMKKGRSL